MSDEAPPAKLEDAVQEGLRSRAEAVLQQTPRSPSAMGADESDALNLLHELQVQHVELQLQNEELEQARAEALVARDSYERLFDRAPVAVFSLARDGRIVAANRAAAELLHESQDALCGRTMLEFLARESVPTWQALLAQADAPAGPPGQPVVLQLAHVDAMPRSVQAGVAFDAATPSVLVTLMDVTERERAEQLQRAAVLALERAARMKDAFLSQMSHELRTPLNAMLGFTHLQLADTGTPFSETNRQRAEQVLRAGQHLLSLIEDALDIASIEAGHVAVVIEPVDVAATVADCLAMIEPQAREQALHLSGPGGATPPRPVLADARRLRQVLLNLISNAVKYNRPGGEVQVDCRTGVQPGRVTIVVSDTGVGIDAQMKERLFMPFDRLGAERTDIEGAGLGLMITRLLVQAMDGTLEIESEAGRGTMASVTLPAAPKLAVPERAAPAPVTESAPAPAAPARLLYIEGDQASRTLMGGVVAGIEGASLVVAPDGLSGLAQARQLRPAVVIVNLDLPDIDGISVLRALRQSPDTRGCHCVAVSTDATEHAAAAMRAAGFDEFWPKPIALEFMRRRLAALLQRG